MNPRETFKIVKLENLKDDRKLCQGWKKKHTPIIFFFSFKLFLTIKENGLDICFFF